MALRKTFELVAVTGEGPSDFDSLFAPLETDRQGALDGVHDTANIRWPTSRSEYGTTWQPSSRIKHPGSNGQPPGCAAGSYVLGRTG